MTGAILATHTPKLSGSRPAKLPENQSIYRLQGAVTVNGVGATLKTLVRVGDTVVTGKNSEVVFVVGGHSMILREDSRLVVEGAKKATTTVTGLRLTSGKLLTTSSNAQTRLSKRPGSKRSALVSCCRSYSRDLKTRALLTATRPCASVTGI